MIYEDRKRHGISNKRLMRARRLYLRLCADSVASEPQKLVVAVGRAVDAGLYSELTLKKDIAYSFIKAAYLKNGGNIGFYQFCRERKLSNQCYKKY